MAASTSSSAGTAVATTVGMGASLLSVTSSTWATGGAFTGAQGAALAMTTGGADRLRVCWRMAGVEKSSAAPRGIVGQPGFGSTADESSA